MQFVSPSGTNAVESAIKLARKQKGRKNIITFTNGFHGMSLGSLSVTGSSYYRDEAFVSRDNVTVLPYEGYMDGLDSLAFATKMIEDKSSGVDLPCAMILETVQGEGGINVASDTWLRGIRELCYKHDILLIVDDIQAGNGRTGKFFSFESSMIEPDLITISKSIGGGLPLSLLLIGQGLDIWKEGEHNGTFRGNNLAFVEGTVALEQYWSENKTGLTEKIIKENARTIAGEALKWTNELDSVIGARGKGMMVGIEFSSGEIAGAIAKRAFEEGLLIETCGSEGQVVKIMPPLTISLPRLWEGLDILDHIIREIA